MTAMAMKRFISRAVAAAAFVVLHQVMACAGIPQSLALAAAFGATSAASAYLPLAHGSDCRRATAVMGAFCAAWSASPLWGLAAWAFLQFACPQSLLWWPRALKSDTQCLEELAEMHRWASDNAAALRARAGHTFNSKIRYHNKGAEAKFYQRMKRDHDRYQGTPALAARLAELDALVGAGGDHEGASPAHTASAAPSRGFQAKTDAVCLEELDEMHQWAVVNASSLRARTGNCFHAKLRQLNKGDEKKFHNRMTKNQDRYLRSPALAARLDLLNAIVCAESGTAAAALAPLASTLQKDPADGGADLASASCLGDAAAASTVPVARRRKRPKTSVGSPQASHGVLAANQLTTTPGAASKRRLLDAVGDRGPLGAESAAGKQKKLRGEVATSQQTDPPTHVGQSEYFEAQQGAWCGMHALNNFLGGPFVDRAACRAAAQQLVRRHRGTGAVTLQDHLHPRTGWLSVDVMNILGAGQLGIHIDESHTDWAELQRGSDAAVLVNWNQTHWTVLQPWPRGGAPTHWRHTNSCTAGRGLRYGRGEYQHHEVAAVLQEIREASGGVTLHRVTRAFVGADAYLEPAGRRALLPAEDAVEEEVRMGDVAAGDVPSSEDRWPRGDTLKLVSFNVAGLEDELGDPAVRMDTIVTKVLVVKHC